MEKKDIQCLFIGQQSKLYSGLVRSLCRFDINVQVKLVDAEPPHVLFALKKLRESGLVFISDDIQFSLDVLSDLIWQYAPDAVVVVLTTDKKASLISTKKLINLRFSRLNFKNDNDKTQLFLQCLIQTVQFKTEFRRCKRLLGISEKRCLRLVESSHEAIAYITRDLHLFANASYLALFSTESAEKLRSISIKELISPKEYPVFRKFLESQLRRCDANRSLVLTMKKSNGVKFRVNIHLIPSVYKGKKCLQLWVSALDKFDGLPKINLPAKEQENDAKLNQVVDTLSPWLEKGVDIQLKRAMKKVGIDIEIKKETSGYSADYYSFTIEDMKHKKIYNAEANRDMVLDILREVLDPIEDKDGVKTSRNVNFGAKATPDGFLFRVQKREQQIMYGEHYRHLLRKGTLDAVFEWNGTPKVIDMYQGVHIMIAGTTGSGKSVALNGIIKGWQSSNTQDTLSLTMVNPKIDTSGGDLFSEFRGSYFLREPILTQVGKSMEAFLMEIDALLDRQIKLMKSIEKDYAENGVVPTKYHVMCFDEVKAIFALDKSNSDEANELNKIRKSIMFKVNIITAEGRSSKVLMLMATQSPTAEVLGGVKANLTIMSLKVANDSQAGVCGYPKKGNDVSAKELNGRGDALLTINSTTYRLQCPM